MHWTRFVLLIAGGLLLLLLFVGYDTFAPQGQARPPDHVALDIMPVKPGGPAQNYAAYVPTTVLNVPANSVVTVTIRNFDLDPMPMAASSPYTRVQGTMGGIAYADGKAYTILDPSAIAHTFTVPALHLNVPIPGQAASGMHYVTVTFRIHTGKAGTYTWRCFAPCGDGADGQAGAMAEADYMRGILFVAD
jgi:hypothetical protein